MEEYENQIYSDVPLPVCGDSDVLVRVMACAVCGGDVHGWDGSTGRRVPPIIMGHEASGVIEQTGNKVSGFRTGDRVTFDSMIFCGKCERCINGETNLCENLSVLGVTFNGANRQGAFAEYVVVPEHIVYPIPEGVSFTETAIAEPLSVAYHAARRFPVNKDDSVLVAGVGIIGSLLIKVLKYIGVRKIVAVDINQKKLNAALRIGATDAVLSGRPDSAEKLKSITGKGFDFAYDVIGLQDTVNLCIENLRDGGGLGLIGNVHEHIRLPLQRIVTKELRISGSYASSHEYDICLKLIADQKIDITDMISAVAPMSEGNDWFKRLHDNKEGLLKIVLIPDSVYEQAMCCNN